MSLVAFQPAVVVYREEQNFDWRVYVFVGVVEILVWIALVWSHVRAAPAGGAALGTSELALGGAVLILTAAAVVGLLRMTTEVTPGELRVWFGWLPTYRKAISVEAIQRLEVVTYRPLADYGGWGIRQGRDGIRVLNARGNRGVRVDLVDGTRLLIGSQHPEDLARALESAKRPGV